MAAFWPWWWHQMCRRTRCTRIVDENESWAEIRWWPSDTPNSRKRPMGNLLVIFFVCVGLDGVKLLVWDDVRKLACRVLTLQLLHSFEPSFFLVIGGTVEDYLLSWRTTLNIRWMLALEILSSLAIWVRLWDRFRCNCCFPFSIIIGVVAVLRVPQPG